MIERIPVTSRKDWLARRGQDITASIAGALVGVHEYATRFSVWAEKTGRAPRDHQETPAMRRGRLLEPVAIELLREERPDWKIEPGKHYFRDPEIRLGATPDAFAKVKGRTGIVQIKTVEGGVFRRKWTADDGVVDVPTWIAIQAIVEAHLTGADFAIVAAMVIGMGIEIHPIEVPIHQGVIDRIREETVDFWKMVEEGREPDPDFSRDIETIAAVYATDDGTEIDLSDDLLFRAYIERRHELKREIADHVSEVEGLDARIIHRIGNAERVHLPGWRISRPLVERRDRLFGTTTSFRQLRIRPERDSA